MSPLTLENLSMQLFDIHWREPLRLKVATDTQIIFFELIICYDTCESVLILKSLHGDNNLIDLVERKLSTAPRDYLFTRGVYEQDVTVSLLRLGSFEHNYRRRNRGKREEITRQSNDRRNQIILNQTPTRLPVATTAEQQTGSSHHNHSAVGSQCREHMQQEREVASITRRHAARKTTERVVLCIFRIPGWAKGGVAHEQRRTS